MKDQSIKFLSYTKGKDCGYVIKEAWANDRLWIAKTFDDLLKWITSNVYQQVA